MILQGTIQEHLRHFVLHVTEQTMQVAENPKYSDPNVYHVDGRLDTHACGQKHHDCVPWLFPCCWTTSGCTMRAAKANPKEQLCCSL